MGMGVMGAGCKGDMMADESRRPIAARNTKWAARLTTTLVRRGITPNAISVASMAAAALAGLAFWGAGALGPGPGAGLLLILGAGFVQLRLLCNLFDGLVAVEGGKGTKDGPFWNEFPDRVADVLILGGFGIAAGLPSLGWLAAALAVMTAYVRELGHALGQTPDFRGPMAKPHRMAALTIGAVAQVVVWILGLHWPVIAWVLWLVLIGTLVTVVRRAIRVVKRLKAA